ncbi:MAG: hypothetical protein M1827_000927 [Pycnora praestabilis]|nr:MAG: hypothetical protein M1827_000927 [Pycnora praestabilis]
MFANYQGSSTRPSYSGQGYITSYTNDPSSDPGDADKRLSRKRRTYCGRDGKGKDNCAEGETCQAEVFLGTDVSFGVPQQRAGWLDGFGLCVSVSKSLTRRSPSSADLVIAVSHPPSSPPNNDIVASPLLAPRTIPGAFPLAWLNLNDDYDYDDDTPFPTNTNSREVEEEQVFCNAQIYGSPTRDDCYEAWMQLPNDRSGERWVFYPESVGEWLGQDCVKTPQTWRWGNCIIAIRNLEGPGHRTTDQETWIHFVDHAAPAVINVCAEGGTGGIVLAGDHDDLSLSIYAPASPYHYYIELGIQCPADPVALTSAECLALQGPPGSSSINADQGDGSSPRSGGGSGGSGAVSTSLKVHVMNEATCDAVACASASDCCSGWACNRGTMAKGAAPIYWGSAAAVGGGRGGWCVSSGGGAGGEL